MSKDAREEEEERRRPMAGEGRGSIIT